MKNTNHSLKCITSVFLTLFSIGCSSHPSDEKIQKSDGRLPSSWYDRSDSSSENSSDIVIPDAKTDKVVQSTLNANLAALDQVADLASGAQSSKPSTQPPDWTPWHLDGMVGYFAVSQGGILGALLYSGTESIKLTWQKVAAAGSTVPTPPKPAPILALKVTPDMSAQDIPNSLEPSIQVALASGAIQNESNFRRNILLHAEKFFNICQLLNTITRSPGWYVDGYQLNVNFSATGEVTPLIGVGGSVNLYFDWSRTTDPTIKPTTTAYPAATTTQLNSFVQLVSAAIPEAVADASDIETAGFHLDMVQVGLGITAGGDVGVVQATGGDIGRILFKQDINVSPSPNASVLPTLNEQHLSLVSTDSPGSSGQTVVRISSRKFTNGLKKAIKMATFFAQRAHKKPASKYQLNQIEAEFDTSLSGDLKLATVNGIGQFVLDFDRIQ